MLDGRDVLLTERRGHIYIVTLNREERFNALSIELRERFEEELETFNEDPDLWVMIVTGAGEKAFCSGMDLKEFGERTRKGIPNKLLTRRRMAHPVVPTWKPMIAAINGFAYAGGWKMAQQCDLRIASETAKLGITENRWNLSAGFAGEQNVFATSAIAAEVVLMGRPITAERACQMGFVNKVVPADQLMAEAISWAEHLCTLGQEAVRGHKKLLYYSKWAPPSEVAELSSDIFYWMGTGKPGVVVDSTVGPRAFAAGEQPDFSKMFEPPRLVCSQCRSEYVVARNGNREGPVICCGMEVSPK